MSFRCSCYSCVKLTMPNCKNCLVINMFKSFLNFAQKLSVSMLNCSTICSSHVLLAYRNIHLLYHSYYLQTPWLPIIIFHKFGIPSSTRYIRYSIVYILVWNTHIQLSIKIHFLDDLRCFQCKKTYIV